MGKQGQPKISFFVKYIIAYKVIQYQKRYNLTLRASWLKLTEQNFSNKVHSQYWVNNILSSDDVKVNFYNHHIKKIIAEFPKLKVYTPTEYKESLARMKNNKTMGLASLKKWAERSLKS